MKVGDIVSRKQDPGLKYKVVEIELNTYQEANDVAHVVRQDIESAPAIPVPRYKWDFWTVHEAK